MNLHDESEMKKWLYFWAIVVLACNSTAKTTSNFCDPFKDFCYCFKVKEYEIQCPPSNFNVIIHSVPDKYISIDCYNQTDYKLDIIPDVNTTAESLEVRFCMLPVDKFKTVLQKFNITNLKRLNLEECELGSYTQNYLNKTFFEGFSSLESLSISSTSKTFEENAFEDLINLTEIFLEQNKFSEIGYIFNNNPKLKVLHLSRNSLKNLPDGIFKKLSNLQELHLWRNELKNVTKNYFLGLKNLKSLELSINSITYIEEDSFSYLPELVNISLRSNQLGFIGRTTFKQNLKIEDIRLGRNPNLILDDYAFANLKNLKRLNLEQCELKNISEHVFENTINLLDLNLQNNKLESLPQNVFQSLKNLKTLNLNKNELAITNKVFSPLEHLEELHLGENAFTYLSEDIFDGLTNLKYLSLKKNKISDINVIAFAHQKNVVKLDLSYNQLRDINKFSYLDKIEELILSHNKIELFLGEVVTLAVNLKLMDLSYNNIHMFYLTSSAKVSNHDVNVNLAYNNISYILFEDAEIVAKQNLQELMKSHADHKSNFTSTHVDVSHNPLLCDCSNFELFQYLQLKLDPVVRAYFDINVDNMKCAGPQEFKHINLKNVLPEQVSCEYKDKHCPIMCECFKRPHDSAVVVDCSYRNLSTLPQISLNDQRIEVNLIGNHFTSGPSKDMGYEKVQNLFLSNNNLSSFDWCPPKIEKLFLDHNNLKHLDTEVLKMFNGSANFSTLKLDHNPWSCGCSAFELQNFLKIHYQKIDVNNVLCGDDSTRLIDRKHMCKSKAALIAQIVIPILVFFFITALLMALYFRYRQEIKIWLFSKNWCMWLVTEEEVDKDKKYDIFLSFSHKDEDFVLQNLVPSLEKSFTLCIHSRDWIPGELINTQIVDSVYNSRRTLVVLSNNFLESAWGKLEFLMALKHSLDEGRQRIIVIKLGELNEEKITDDIRTYTKTNTYVEWGEPWFWKKLLYALPHSCKNVEKNNQKHTNMMLKIDDKFELVSQPISFPSSTPPAVSVENTLLKKHPLNFIASNNVNNLPEIPLIKSA